MEENPQILIVHTDYDKISGIAEFLKANGFLIKHIVSPLEAFKVIPTLHQLFGVLLQKESKPLPAYKVVDYIKTELKQHNFFVVISENKTITLSDDEKEVFNLELHEDASKEDLNNLLSVLNNKEKIQKPKEQLYSLDYLKEVSDNNLEFIKESLQLFKNSVAKDVEELTFNLKSDSYKEIRGLAHRIKPSFAMVCSQKGVKVCDEITYNAEDSDLENAISELQKTYFAIVNLMEKDFPNLN